MTADDVRQVGAECFGVGLDDRRRLDAGRNASEAGRLEPPPCRVGVSELPRIAPGRKVWCEFRVTHQRGGAIAHALDVGTATTLSHQPSTWLQRSEQAVEQRGMIEDP